MGTPKASGAKFPQSHLTAIGVHQLVTFKVSFNVIGNIAVNTLYITCDLWIITTNPCITGECIKIPHRVGLPGITKFLTPHKCTFQTAS